MKRKEGNLWIILGLLLLAAALCLVLYNIGDEMRAARSARQAAGQLAEHIEGSIKERQVEKEAAEEIEIPDYLLAPDMEMPVQNVDGIDYIGILQIKALGLELPIISRWSYPNLKIAPCRYEGSAYLNHMIIAAHNYPSHFGSIQDLTAGDEIDFIDVDGNLFRYEVVVVETLMPTAVEEMTEGDYDLTLFTCTLGGQSRVTVRCKRVKNK